MSNELFAIHIDGKILEAAQYSKLVGNSKYWTPPKKIFTKRGHAKISLANMPEEIRKRCEIVRYIPEEK